MLQLEHSSSPSELDFILFSDILVWLMSADTEPIAEWEWHRPVKVKLRPGMVRTRSKSEAELPTLANSNAGASTSTGLTRAGSKKTRHASTGGEDRWIYKGHAGLIDLEVVVPPLRDQHDERRFDILSPETSFSVFAGAFCFYLGFFT
jgi:FYVE, RhoGEF and PH domain containing 5/6